MNGPNQHLQQTLLRFFRPLKRSVSQIIISKNVP